MPALEVPAKQQLFIFGLDGCIIQTHSGKQFRQHAADWLWIPGCLEKIRTLKAEGHAIALATNHANVAFEWRRYTQKEVEPEIQEAAEAMQADFVAVCYTSTNPKALPEYYNSNDPRRKPNPGMIEECLAAFPDIPKERVTMIGFLPEDEQAASRAGIGYAEAEQFFFLSAIKDDEDVFF